MSRPFKTRLDQLQGKKNATPVITAATYTLRELPQGDRRLVQLNLPAGQAGLLPFATGKGSCYRLFVIASYTGSSSVAVQAGNNPKTAARDVIQGYAGVGGTASGQFGAGATSHTLTMNGTTQGGLVGSYMEFEDVAPGLWRVAADLNGSGTAVTPFS